MRPVTRVFTNKRTLLDPITSPLEQLLYRMTGINPGKEINWREYTTALVLFNLYVRQLRLKIQKDPSRPSHIITEPGAGYRLV